MDDVASVYSTSQKSNLPGKEDDEGPSVLSGMRRPMNKKELQAFMKAKLAKTKVTDQVTTQASASGPVSKKFQIGGTRRGEPTQRKDLIGPQRKPPAPKKPTATPSTYKGKGNEIESEDSEDDIAAANEKMKLAAMKFAINAANQSSSSTKPKKKGARAPSRGAEEHKTAVRNTSKNIYKPCFNMPAKEPKASIKPAEKPK